MRAAGNVSELHVGEEGQLRDVLTELLAPLVVQLEERGVVLRVIEVD